MEEPASANGYENPAYVDVKVDSIGWVRFDKMVEAEAWVYVRELLRLDNWIGMCFDYPDAG